MSVSKIDILNHDFSRSLRGYNPQQVDGYLQDIADTIGQITEEKTALANQVAILEAQLAEHKEREATLRDTLITTQKLTDSLKATAQKEAQLIIDSAHSRAESLMQQGIFVWRN
jgi:DivIVA domain